MVIAVIALLSELTLTRFDRSYRSVMGCSSGIFIVHALSLSLLLSFSQFSPRTVQPFTVTATATTGMVVSTVGEVPISKVRAASNAVTVSSSMLTSTTTTSSGSRPIPASLPGGLADLLAFLIRTAVRSELSGAAGHHRLPSGPPTTVGPSMALTASVSTPPVVSLPSSLVVPMVPVVPPTPVVSSSSSVAAAGILPGMFLPAYLHDLWEGPPALPGLHVPTKLMVYNWRSFGVVPASSSSFPISLFPSSSSYSLPLYLYFFWDLPQTFCRGYWFAYLSIPHGMYTVIIAGSGEVILLIISVVLLTTIAVSLMV